MDDLIAKEAASLRERLESSDLKPQGHWSQDEFRSRLSRYQAATEPMARVVGAMGRWSDGTELPLVLDVIRTLYRQAKAEGSGLSAWLHIRSYPTVLVFWAYGIGLTRAERWTAVRELLKSSVAREGREPKTTANLLFLWNWEGADDNLWKNVEGLERQYTPFSDHLVTLFAGWAKSFVGLEPDFELLSGRFEMLGSLCALDEEVSEADLAESLERQGLSGAVRMPVGRVTWRSEVREPLLQEFQTGRLRDALLAAGFAKSSTKFIDLFIANFQRIASRMRW